MMGTSPEEREFRALLRAPKTVELARRVVQVSLRNPSPSGSRDAWHPIRSLVGKGRQLLTSMCLGTTMERSLLALPILFAILPIAQSNSRYRSRAKPGIAKANCGKV